MKSVILAILLTSLTTHVFADQKIRFASSPTNPPFEFLNQKNQLTGFDIDLANALCQQMKATCTFSIQSFDSLIPALQFKKYDAVIASMDITPARSKQVAFTDSYYSNSAEVIAKKGRFNSFADLQGKRVGVENGTTHQRYLLEKHPEITMVPYDNHQSIFIDLQNGRLDGVLGDSAVVNTWLKQHPDMGSATPRITDPHYYATGMGIAVQLHNNALLDQLNSALKAIKADGTYQKIVDKWSI